MANLSKVHAAQKKTKPGSVAVATFKKFSEGRSTGPAAHARYLPTQSTAGSPQGLAFHPHIQHADLGITSTYLQGIDPSEIIKAIHSRRQPTIPAIAGLDL